ncbi:mitochondrial import receptor subunit TOM40 homolog 1 [Venturia canescens]|uniref:mitochondrial import receptor subunit TOM40 homolog 1 n=1 Tax=Venturia canescens TaxID=32260 RepID=UPI001C9D3D83|nr:mitochondrial import receptor subunit TOM40 homolog 1-like [Venturia canescens]
MGNVLAASAPPPPPPPSTAYPPNLGKPEISSGNLAPQETSARLENPGTIDELHKLCKDVFPMNFEGARLLLNRGLSNHFQISHTLTLSSAIQSGYKFGATYVGTKQTGPTEAYPVFLGDIDPSGNLNANILHQLAPRLKGKLATQVQNNKFTAVQLTTDYRGDSYTASLTLGNPDITNGTGLMVGHYLQTITPSLALGTEIAHQRSPVPGGQITVVSAVGRYTSGESTVSASVGLTGVHLCFHQKVNTELQVSAELEVNARVQESTATVAYQYDLPKADLVFKGSVDSNWTVAAVLEKKLQPLPFTLALSGVLNHSKPDFKLGCGLMIG